MIVNELVTKFSFNVGSSFKKLDRNLGQTVKNTNTATTKMGGAFKRMGETIRNAAKVKISILGSAQAKAVLSNLKNQMLSVLRKTIKSNNVNKSIIVTGIRSAANLNKTKISSKNGN